MDTGLVRFVALLRSQEVRVSTGEVIDAARALAAVGLADRATVKDVLGGTLVKDKRDRAAFSRLFDLYFHLEDPGHASVPHDHDHGHEHLEDQGSAEQTTISDDVADRPAEGHSHDQPKDVKEFFEDRDMETRYSLHQEANKVDLTSGSDQLLLSRQQQAQGRPAGRVQMQTERLHGAFTSKGLASSEGVMVDVDLSVVGRRSPEAGPDDADIDTDGLDAYLADLPARLKEHLETLAAQGDRLPGEVSTNSEEHFSQTEQDLMEDALRRLGRTLRGAMTHRKRVAPRGRIDVAKTMRRNLRFDGTPFVPVTVGRREDRPRLVVLADVSLSVRNTARFTLHMIHGLQRIFPLVRTYIFVDRLADITELFEEHPVEHAMGLVFEGKIMDVDSNSAYGPVFDSFVANHLATVTRRTSVLVLGDGRNNGSDPGLASFEAIARHARRVVWLTPEPRYSWSLGSCDMADYSDHCERVEVVRSIDALLRVATEGEAFGWTRS